MDREREPYDRGWSPRHRQPEEWRGRGDIGQGYGEREYGSDRTVLRSGERNYGSAEYGRRWDPRGPGDYRDEHGGDERWSGNQGWGGGQGFSGGETDRDRERFGENRRSGFSENRGGRSRWDRFDPRSQGYEGYRSQNQWASTYAPWGDPARNRERGGGDYARGGNYYADAGSVTQWGHERAEEGPYRGRGPRGYRRSDERIREDVCEWLTRDPWIDATNIEIEVKEGEVTLSGSVDSRQAKRRAEDAIENISGVRDIHNHLRVDAGALQGQNTTDLTTTTQNREPNPEPAGKISGRTEKSSRAA